MNSLRGIRFFDVELTKKLFVTKSISDKGEPLGDREKGALDNSGCISYCNIFDYLECI